METYFAPSVTASLTAVPRSVKLAEVASTSRMWQFGQVAETMSRSSEISPAQPESGFGRLLVDPDWLTFSKQPLPVLQDGRRYWAR